MWASSKVRDDVWDMDIDSFDLLYGSLKRNEAREIIRDAYVRGYAAHDPKGLDKFLAPYKALLCPEDFANDEEAFVRAVGAGF